VEQWKERRKEIEEELGKVWIAGGEEEAVEVEEEANLDAPSR